MSPTAICTEPHVDKSFLTASIPELVSKLSPDEKAELLSGKDAWSTRDVPRLGIPSIKVTDGGNGARGESFFKRTPGVALPCATALASTFSRSTAAAAGSLLAEEAKARGATCLLAPNINTQRSGLGGRSFEYYSEDTTLSGHMAAAMVKALQAGGVSATMKHFVANDQEDGRQGVDAVIDPRTLREVYLRPFQIVQRLAQPWAYMTAYNRLHGIHCSEDPGLLRDLLRGEWGFDGLVMSDWGGTYSTVEALNAGLDLEMGGPGTWRAKHLIGLSVSCFKLDPRTIDERVEAVLRWSQKLARLNPEVVFNPRPVERTRTEAEKDDAKTLRAMASESIVLLKNEAETLPLGPEGRVAVIGPGARSSWLTGGGSATLRHSWWNTPWDGLVDNCPSGTQLEYAHGCLNARLLPILDDNFTCVDGCPGFDLLHYPIVNGKPALKPTTVDRADNSEILFADWAPGPGLLPDYLTELRAIFTAPVTGEYEFGVCCTGTASLYVDNELVIDMTRPLPRGATFFTNGTDEHRGRTQVQAGRTYAIRLVNDSRRAPSDVSSQSFIFNAFRLGASSVLDEDALMEEAVSAAVRADTAVVCVGLGPEWESESFDRPSLSLPGRQNELVSRVAAAAKRTVVVIQAGSTVTMPWLTDVYAVVYAWYGGNEAGNAIADVLYGAYNPAGRLPLSFPCREEDIAAHLNFRNARTQVNYGEGIWIGYKHHNARRIAPLFPFGHGLSYTTFEYSHLAVTASPPGTSPGSWELTASITLTNTGSRTGSHSVHIYLAPPPTAPMGLLHPEHTLQGFSKEYDLAPGESRVVEITMDKYAISHWDERWRTWRAEPGTWRAMVGRDAQTMCGEAVFTVGDRFEWCGL